MSLACFSVSAEGRDLFFPSIADSDQLSLPDVASRLAIEASAGRKTPLRGRTVIKRSGSPKPSAAEPVPKGRSIDTLGNFVPGSCFESGVAISILDYPGKAGETLDWFAREFSKTLDLVYAPDGIGGARVRHNGKEVSLRTLYDTKILGELRPECDQIGRCQDVSLEVEWFEGAGVKWLKDKLATSSTSPFYHYSNALTKIRVLHPFGAYIIIELLEDLRNAPIVAKLLGKDADVVIERCMKAKQLVWDKEFNSVAKRARMERPPFVGGVSFEGMALRDGWTCSDFGYGRAFGLIYHPDDIWPKELRDQYEADLRKFGQQGIRRANQPIEDDARPGILSEFAVQFMPEPFRLAGLELQLSSHKFSHGTGLNRWNPVGSYARESRAHSLPVAGSHSGGAANLFVGLNCLSVEPILGKKDVAEQMGLLFSSFTIFGGYHTIVETFPIAQAVATITEFKIVVDERQGRHGKNLYADFVKAAQVHTGAGISVRKLRCAYRECLTPEERTASRRCLPFVVIPLPLDEEERTPSPLSDESLSPLSSRSPSPSR